MDEPQSSLHVDSEKVSLTSKAFVGGAGIFFLASFYGFFYFFILLARMKELVVYSTETVFTSFLRTGGPAILSLLSASISALIGYLLLRAAGTLTKAPIPERDRAMLVPLISEEKSGAIDQYIRLSSLIGATGFFTRLGLVGLPLTTVALTIFFTLLSVALWKLKDGSDLSGRMLDLGKLTLGAFIGSYVQKQATEGQKTLPNTGQPRPILATAQTSGEIAAANVAQRSLSSIDSQGKGPSGTQVTQPERKE